jgi:hypothetical protein
MSATPNPTIEVIAKPKPSVTVIAWPTPTIEVLKPKDTVRVRLAGK